jgi:hypothetical protein
MMPSSPGNDTDAMISSSGSAGTRADVEVPAMASTLPVAASIVDVVERPDELESVAEELDALSTQPAVSIVDAITGEPVPEAAIYSVARYRGTSPKIGVSDPNGNARVEVASLRRDGLLVLADGYLEYREAATLRDLDSTPHVVKLEPEFTARVQVTLPDGAPATEIPLLVHTQLRGLDDPESIEIVTDENGEATYVSRYEDTSLVVDVEGFSTESLPATTPLATVTLRPGRQVDGRVKDPDGTTIEACRVKLVRDDWQRAIWKESDANGQFTLGGFDAGDEVTLSFFHEDFPGYRQTLTIGQETDLDFVLPEGVTLEGVTRDSDDVPIAGGMAFLMVPSQKTDTKSTVLISTLNTAGMPRSGRG